MFVQIKPSPQYLIRKSPVRICLETGYTSQFVSLMYRVNIAYLIMI
nr:MAG TPA: hypothetical protein [Crassvirales sp.]